ncbi:MAG: RHS repeat-associated core domain-containing protein, partial [Acidobacteriota bacterium]|nr:RHS repeat-associated core domain-containing protein [Acidobacteriota bacterium]
SHIADHNGALLESYRYDLYGKPTYWSPSGSQLSVSSYSVKDLYTGQRWVPELGLYDDRNRFMSPDLGRFLQPDPIGFKGDSSNLYRYCGNDWANRSDPMGLEDQTRQGMTPSAAFIAGQAQWDAVGRGQGAIGVQQAIQSSLKALAAHDVEATAWGGTGGNLTMGGTRKEGKHPFQSSGRLNIDDDGAGSAHNDRNHSPTLPGGSKANADTDVYVASTPAARKAGVRIGDRAILKITKTGRTVNGTVQDSRTHTGVEVSVRAAQDAGLIVKDGPSGPEVYFPGDESKANIHATITYPDTLTNQ